MTSQVLLKLAKSHMATDFEFEIVATDSTLRSAESVALQAHELIHQIEEEITEFRERSPVWILNHSPVGKWVEVTPNLASLLQLSRRLYEESGGYFNPFAKSIEGADFSDFEEDVAHRRMRRMHAGLQLGFGAIGKGFALDCVAALFRREGFTDFRLNSGGSSWVFSGRDQNEESWKISWAWERDADGVFLGRLLQIPNREMMSVGVSGILEQGNHFRFRGDAAPARIQSAFYAGRSAAEADALSTALLVGASVEGDGILTRLENRIKNPSIAYIDLEGQIIYNRDFHTHFLSPEGISR